MTDFPLPDEDREYLDATFPSRWQMCSEDRKIGLVISQYELPNGYTPDCTDLMLIIPTDYPATGINMFYFAPPITRRDRVLINALSNENHFGRTWQRWSRHYDWQAGIDNIANHVTYVSNELKSELRK